MSECRPTRAAAECLNTILTTDSTSQTPLLSLHVLTPAVTEIEKTEPFPPKYSLQSALTSSEAEPGNGPPSVDSVRWSPMKVKGRVTRSARMTHVDRFRRTSIAGSTCGAVTLRQRKNRSVLLVPAALRRTGDVTASAALCARDHAITKKKKKTVVAKTTKARNCRVKVNLDTGTFLSLLLVLFTSALVCVCVHAYPEGCANRAKDWYARPNAVRWLE